MSWSHCIGRGLGLLCCFRTFLQNFSSEWCVWKTSNSLCLCFNTGQTLNVCVPPAQGPRGGGSLITERPPLGLWSQEAAGCPARVPSGTAASGSQPPAGEGGTDSSAPSQPARLQGATTPSWTLIHQTFPRESLLSLMTIL